MILFCEPFFSRASLFLGTTLKILICTLSSGGGRFLRKRASLCASKYLGKRARVETRAIQHSRTYQLYLSVQRVKSSIFQSRDETATGESSISA